MVRQLEAKKIAEDLIKQHSLSDWKIDFNKSPRFLGQCWHFQKSIVLSTVMLNSCSEAELRDTILHEIAHAIVGPGHKHDEVWKAKAKEIGCTSNECGMINLSASRRVEPSQVKEIKVIPKLEKKCPKCGATVIIESQAKFGEKTFLKLKCGHLVRDSDVVGISFKDWTSKSGKKLFDFQVEGAELIVSSGARCLIADEPALGKTMQALSFLKFYPDIALPAIWVTKSKLKIQAAREALDWCGPEYFPCTIDSSRSFILPNFKVYVVSMDLLRRLTTEKLDLINPKTLIFDEIQHIANPDSARTTEVRRLAARCEHVIFLSGHPWKNRSNEFFSALNMLRPDLFPSQKHFDSTWVDWYEDSQGKWKPGPIRNIPRFREITKSFVIRRLRDDVLDLPPINRDIEYVELESIYGESYEKAEKGLAERIKTMLLEGDINLAKIQNDIMNLKHIVGLSKIDFTVEKTQEFLDQTEDWEKLTIFHHHIDVGDELEKKLESSGVKVLRLRGGMDPWDANRIIMKFKDSIHHRVLIASTLASGEGLNLQFCQNAFMMERQWNPANEEQAEFRFSRPLSKSDLPPYLQEHLINERGEGKKVSINIPYLVVANSVDEILTEIIERKRYNFHKSMNPGEEELQWSENEVMKELASLIVKKRYGVGK